MEWARNVFQYTPLEQELLATDCGNSLYERYNQTLNIDGTEVYVVAAPPPNAKKIPKLPPIVLLHGLGGSMQAFTHLSRILNRTTQVILVDLPGHGKSPDPPKSPHAFSAQTITSLLTKVVDRLTDPDLPFVLLGHSYGTTHALRVALTELGSRCTGVICLCPPYGHTVPQLERRIAARLPILLFDSVFRSRDRVGGLYSPSVNRMVATDAGERPRREQLRTNLQSKSNTVLLTVAQSSFYNESGTEGVPDCPILVVAAAEDKVCPPQRSERMVEYLRQRNEDVQLKTVSGAGHAVILEKPEVLGAIISKFLAEKIDERLSMSWQLSYLASLDNKWSLKNENKWKEVTPVGEKVGRSSFKGMKVPREGDSLHSPTALEESHPEIVAIVDISRESPPYDPTMFKRIKYHKFPTVSKIPPSKAEVKGFLSLIRDIKDKDFPADGIIGVHCHYGFNRTGFFICSYLVEKEGYSVPDALKAYRESRPPGIKHQHFINELYVRNSA